MEVIELDNIVLDMFHCIYRIVASPNEWQQVCDWPNHEKTSRSCERADFSGLSSKVPNPDVSY
jgi:hypothetical protein